MEETSGDHLVKFPYSKQGHHLEPVVLDHVLSGFECFLVWTLHSLSGQPVWCSMALTVKTKWGLVFKVFNPMFQFVPIDSCPTTGHHWEESGYIFFTPSLQVFIYINKIPRAFYLSKSFMQKSFMRYKIYEVAISLHKLFRTEPESWDREERWVRIGKKKRSLLRQIMFLHLWAASG